MTASTGHGGGASVFDPVLAELICRWFCLPGGTVLDPFAGGPTRGIVASRLGLRYTGIELRRAQVLANRRQCRLIARSPRPRWIIGDARDVRRLAPARYDLLFTCPPYADLEVYSDDPRDLSTMRYPSFLGAMRFVIAEASALLRADRFAVIVIGEVRDASGMPRGLVQETLAAGLAAGLRLFNEAVFLQPAGSLPLRAPAAFLAGRKLGRAHQGVLVFAKGNPAARFHSLPPLPPANIHRLLPRLPLTRAK